MEKVMLDQQNHTPKKREMLSRVVSRGLALWQTLREEYLTLFRNIGRLFNIYGGVKRVFTSPFFHVSLVVSLIVQTFHSDNWLWYDISISCLPSIIGMSLTGYALILTFGSETFREAIRGKSPEANASEVCQNPESPYMNGSSSFAAFLFFQVVSLVFAIIFKSIEVRCVIVSFIGTCLLCYSLLLTIAVTLNTFFLSCLYDKMPKE